MNNLLPDFTQKFESSTNKLKKFRDWRPSSADPNRKEVSYALAKEFTVDNESFKQPKINQIAKFPPNHINESDLEKLGPSPLSVIARGVAEPPHLSITQLQNAIKTRRMYHREISSANSYTLLVRVMSHLDYNIDLFIRKKNTMLTSYLLPNQEYSRVLDGDLQSDIATTPSVTIYLAPANRNCVSITGRQEIRHVSFVTSQRIGLEVEIVNNKLTCNRVIESSQASAHEIHLIGCEILAINFKRVITLEQFEQTIYMAKLQAETLVLTIASFIGGKQKSDDIYTRSIRGSQQFKSLLSNILSSGFDNEHQHDIELPSSSHSNNSESLEGVEKEEQFPVKQRQPFNLTVEDKEIEKEVIEDVVEEVTEESPKYIFDDYESIHFDNENLNDDNFMDDQDGLQASRRHVNRDTEVEHNLIDTQSHHTLPKDEPSPVASIKKEDDITVNSQESNDSWDHMTKVETAIFPFISLICLPKELDHSNSWGHPKHYIQFTNFSSSLNLEIYWIDEDSALVPRKKVVQGDSHFELCSIDHIWAVLAVPLKAEKALSILPDGEQSIMLLFKPSLASLQDGKCLSFLWSPNTSLSLTQTMYLKSTKDSKHIDYKIQPNIHVQLFDNIRKGNNNNDEQVLEAKFSEFNINKRKPRRKLLRSKSVHN